MSFIGRSWKGEEPLWKVFWLYGVLPGIGIGMLFETNKDMGVGLALICFCVVYNFWQMISQWRCAFNASWSIWGYIVRVWVIIAMINLLVVALGIIFIGNTLGWSTLPSLMKEAATMGEARSAEERLCKKEKFVMQYLSQNSPQEFEQYKQQNRTLLEKCATLKTRSINTKPAESAPMQASGGDADLQELFKKMCLDEMEAHAVKNNADPKQYISDNPQYLQDCTEYRMYNASKPQTPAKP